MGIIKTYFETKRYNSGRNQILGVIVIGVFCIGIANTLDYFFAGKNYLKIYRGTVDSVIHDNYEESGSKNGMRTRTTLYLMNNMKEFYVSDDADNGGYIDVMKGDYISLYTRRWFQVLYFVIGPSNIYIVEKDGRWIYNNTGEWKTKTFGNMVFFGILFFLLLFVYIDIVWDISFFKWIRKRLQ